jgi:iron complex outermembrane receptor protein
LSERNAGRTRLAGLFAEGSWSLPAGLSLTLGARFERWNAYGGRRVLAQNSVGYPRRNDDGWSPKAVLAWQAAPGWSLQAQAARAIRFPTVAELFQSRTTGGALVQSDPNLRPERSRNYAINAIHTTTLAGAAATLRLTAFDDDVRDVLYSQSNVFTNASYYQNIGRVRTRGLETMIGVQGLYDGLLDFEASAALQRSRIEENANLPASVGKEFVRVPHWRAKAQAILHPAPDWTASAGLRAEGKQYNDILNGDNRSDSYGYTSNFLFAEARVSWRLDLHTELAIGVDNLFDAKGYIFYPYPGRTATASLSWRL